MHYNVIGKGSDQQIFILGGVKGGVIALIDSDEDCIIFAIKCNPNNFHTLMPTILPEFIDDDTIFAGCRLSSTWGWRGSTSLHRDVLRKFRGYYSTSYDGMNTIENKISWIESQFRIIKSVYDRNVNRSKMGK